MNFFRDAYGAFMDLKHIKMFDQNREWRRCHLKRDGYCLFVKKDAEGNLHTYTKKPARVEKEYPKVLNQEWYRILKEGLIPNIGICGELFFESGASSADTRTILAGNGIGSFEAFTICNKRDGKIPYSWNDEDYLRLKEDLENAGLVFIKEAELDMNNIPAGYEGYVVKKLQYPFQSYDWMKCKPELTVDLRITGFTVGNARYARTFGALLVESDDGKIKAKAQVAEDEVRIHMHQNRNWWYGKIVEIAYQMKLGNGTLRHPRFKRIREDLSETSPGDLK